MMRTMHVAVVTALAASIACELPALPSAPSGPGELQIRGATLLMVGGRGRLTAWAAQDGQLREVRATWSADGDAIAITSDGLVTGRRLGHAIVHASAGESTGTGTVHVVTSVAGRWRGTITVLDCWQTTESVPNPCQGRRGLVAPLLLDVTQSASANQFDNLRAVAEVFTPPARGDFIGALDSSGQFFLDGYVNRQSDAFGGAVRFRWQLEQDRLVPFSIDGDLQDRVDVQLSVRLGSTATAFNEIWQLSAMTR